MQIRVNDKEINRTSPTGSSLYIPVHKGDIFEFGSEYHLSENKIINILWFFPVKTINIS